MKVLNLYSGLGGNRSLWTGCEVTSVELDSSISAFYRDRFPVDTLVIGDAHQYLLDHYREFDFIWSSPPCPTHSRARYWNSKGNESVQSVYPDMKLYQEILFLRHYFDGKWIVENVAPFYKPLIRESVKIGRHLFWTNFNILPPRNFVEADCTNGTREEWEDIHGFSIDGYKFTQRTDKILRNCVQPDLGLHIFNESKRTGLFTI